MSKSKLVKKAALEVYKLFDVMNSNEGWLFLWIKECTCSYCNMILNSCACISIQRTSSAVLQLLLLAFFIDMFMLLVVSIFVFVVVSVNKVVCSFTTLGCTYLFLLSLF